MLIFFSDSAACFGFSIGYVLGKGLQIKSYLLKCRDEGIEMGLG